MNRILTLSIASLVTVFSAGTATAADPTADQSCLACHDEKARGGKNEGPSLDMGKVRQSVHAELTCVECHTDAKGDDCRAGLADVACGGCHEDQEALFVRSVHGTAKNEKGQPAVGCVNCHGTHDTLTADDPGSSVYPTELPSTCGSCHDSKDDAEGKRPGFALDQYLNSIHYTGLAEAGLVVSATCVSCHGNHDTRALADPKARVNRRNIPTTCGTCHEGMYEDYSEGAHGQLFRTGSSDAPICTDCHGDHGILDKQDPKSSVYASTVSKMTCPQCHNAEYINRKYGLASGQVESYQETFHGLADQFGDTTVANCASCHQPHLILPADDPRSAINPENLAETCGSCHPGAGPNFAKGSAHRPTESEGAAVLGYVRFAYLGIIGMTLGGMALHNGLDYYATLRERYRASKKRRRYQRFNLSERVQHIVLVLTFFVLVFTGFALKYPDAFWVRPIIDSELGFLVRGYAHRVAAVLFIAASLYHLVYLFTTRRGRSQLLAMKVTRRDGRELWHQLRYYVGLEQKPASFSRFSYVEKAEYLALIWGSIVMIITGFILWFEEGALLWMPKWGWDVADLVHLYEAWLATASIIVWHLYHVAFKPSGHGVSMAMATGELTEEEMRHEHSAELETLPPEHVIEPETDEPEREASHDELDPELALSQR